MPFARVGDSDLFILHMEIPAASRVEYKIELKRGRKRRLVRDPLNPEKARDPFGANSVLHSQGYQTPEWVKPDEGARPGTIVRRTLDSRVFEAQREVSIYLPARLRPRRRHPLLIVHDGSDYLRYAALGTVLDNVIERLEIEPLIVAMVDSPARLGEYAGDPRHGRFIVDEVIPLLEAQFPVQRDPSSRGLMGASFGGVASLATAWQHPETFGRLLLQSGSFAFSDVGGRHERGPVFDPVVEFMESFRENPGKLADRVFMSCGVYESLIYENRSLVPLLQAQNLTLRYVEARDGHNWLNWRDRLREGLAWLYPGPLWMVYE
jgi:enterochelin esterase family protein